MYATSAISADHTQKKIFFYKKKICFLFKGNLVVIGLNGQADGVIVRLKLELLLQIILKAVERPLAQASLFVVIADLGNEMRQKITLSVEKEGCIGNSVVYVHILCAIRQGNQGFVSIIVSP